MAKSNHGALKLGIGLAVAAAAAGAYYFYGKNGAKHRKHLKGWMLKAKAEVVERLEKISSDVTESKYLQVVSDVLKKYQRLKVTTPKEIAALSKELKGHWKSIKSEISA